MGARVTPAGFERFVALVFDHDDPKWMWGDHDAWQLEEDPRLVVECMAHVFEDPSTVSDRFTSEQVAVGVDYLTNPALSNCAFALLDEGVPLDDRLRALRSIQTLYERFFAHVLPSKACNGSSESRASHVCFMFWDVFPFFGRTTNPYTKEEADVLARWDEHKAIERTCIDALEGTLQIEHLACQEAALHGLGHWHSADPKRVEAIVGRYLEHVGRRHPLHGYATQARKGNVL